MILLQVFIGSTIMLATAIVHAVGTAVGLRWLVLSRAHSQTASLWTRGLVIGALVLIMFVATLIEAGLWATTYVVLEAISGFEEALYFSTVTYTTLGYGDVVLDDPWRLLSAFEAANGLLQRSVGSGRQRRIVCCNEMNVNSPCLS